MSGWTSTLCWRRIGERAIRVNDYDISAECAASAESVCPIYNDQWLMMSDMSDAKLVFGQSKMTGGHFTQWSRSSAVPAVIAFTARWIGSRQLLRGRVCVCCIQISRANKIRRQDETIPPVGWIIIETFVDDPVDARTRDSLPPSYHIVVYRGRLVSARPFRWSSTLCGNVTILL